MRITALLLTLTLFSQTANAAIVRAVWSDAENDRIAFEFDDELPGPQAVANLQTISSSGVITNIATAGAFANQLSIFPTRLSVLAGTADPMTFTFVQLGTDAISVDATLVAATTGAFNILNGELALIAIPEPSTMAGVLLLSIVGIGRRRQRHQLV